MSDDPIPCTFCGETRPHFAPGGYCVKVLKSKLEEALNDLQNERDTRRDEPGYGVLMAIANANRETIHYYTQILIEYDVDLRAVREDADRLAKELADCARFIEITGIGIIPPEIHAALAAHEALKGRP